MSGWFERRALGDGQGRGFGFARYKNIASFAVVADVEVDEEVRPSGSGAAPTPAW